LKPKKRRGAEWNPKLQLVNAKPSWLSSERQKKLLVEQGFRPLA